jgi:hypothetical protein
MYLQRMTESRFQQLAFCLDPSDQRQKRFVAMYSDVE